MSCLKEIVKVNKKFQKSIHMRLDYNRLEKIESYIPTRASVQILKQYLYHIVNNRGDKASVLVGPYGKGKSHVLLILTALLSKTNRKPVASEKTKLVIKNLVNKIKNVDKEAGEYAEQLINDKKAYLPVLVSGTNGALGKAFLLALKEALERDGLERIVPHTYFDEAMQNILQWKENYPETYEIFLKYLQEKNMQEKIFEKRLRNYDETALEFFQNIYPKLTAGSIFEPMVQMDVITLYKSVNETLCTRYGYGGIVLIFDEFSKFVEGYPKERFSNAMEELQSLCELANSTGEYALHVILVAHKAIKEYKNVLPQEVINAYTGVEGRIGEVRFTVSLQNSYELIQNAVYKEETLFEQEVAATELFQKIQEESYQLPYFRSTFSKKEFENIVMKGCFPLTPVAAYLLLKISEKAVQNERTVFTFLVHEEPYSLARFVKEHKEKENMYVTAGQIYDYFSNIFKNDSSNVIFHNEWLKAEYACTKVKTLEEKEVLKTIALLRMVGKNDEMLAKDDVIRLGAGLEINLYEIIMETLKQKQILFFRSKIRTYAFKNNIGVNLEKEIDNVVKIQFQKLNICEGLEKVSELEYVLPKRYNQKYTMTRYFHYQFMTIENFIKLSKTEYLFEDKFADGKIIALVKTKQEALESISKHLAKLQDERIVVIYPNEMFLQEENLKKILAVRYLKQQEAFIEQNKALEQELDLYEEDLLFELNTALEQHYLPIHGKCTILYKENQYSAESYQKQKSGSYFNQLLSQICEHYYYYAPRINNEMINKQKLTAQIKKARMHIIENLLKKSDISMYRKGTAPEATIFRAVFVKTGLLGLREGEKVLSYEKDNGVEELLGEIKKFIQTSAGKKQCFSNLYEILQGKNYGARKGVLPLYLAYEISLWRDTPIIYFMNQEIRLEAQTFENINCFPENYYLYLEEGTVEKEMYLLGLENLFFYGKESEDHYLWKDKNRLMLLADRIHEWYCSLPQCSMNASIDSIIEIEQPMEIQRGLKVFRESFRKVERNPREILFERLPDAFETKNNYMKLLENISLMKQEMEGYIEKIKKLAVSLTRMVFGFTSKDDLQQCLKGWYQEQGSQGRKYVHTQRMSRFMNCIQKIKTHNENEIVEELSKAVLDLYIEDWKENSSEQYQAELQKIKDEIEQLAKEESRKGSRKIIFTNEKGVEIERHFDAEEEENGVSQFFRNEIESALEEFGDTLEMNQKVSVMVEMLEKLLME